MLYIFYGDDFAKARDSARRVSDALRAKKPDALFRVIEGDDATPEVLYELLSAQGLFERKYIVLLRGTLGVAEFRDAVSTECKRLASSEHVFLIVEETIPKTLLSELARVARDAREYTRKETKRKEPSLFTLADALARRDRRALWVGFHEALWRGAVPEEIHGVLSWQVRSMQKARRAESAQASGLSPFVFQKARRARGVFSHKETNGLARSLTRAYHDARRGRDLTIAIECFILAL